MANRRAAVRGRATSAEEDRQMEPGKRDETSPDGPPREPVDFPPRRDPSFEPARNALAEGERRISAAQTR